MGVCGAVFAYVLFSLLSDGITQDWELGMVAALAAFSYAGWAAGLVVEGLVGLSKETVPVQGIDKGVDAR